MQLTTTKKEEKIPRYAQTEWFKQFLDEFEENLDRPTDKKKKFRQIAKELGITHGHFRDCLIRDYTKDQMKNILLRRGLEDSTEVYQTIFENRQDSKHAKLYLDYFTPFKPDQEDTNKGNINVFVGVFSSDNKQNVEEVEVKVVKDDS